MAAPPAPPPPLLTRAISTASKYVPAKVWCFERKFEGEEEKPPVRLVVFDCDETLTVSTFLPDEPALKANLDYSSEWADYIAKVNFQSPFVDQPRIQHLKKMLEDITDAESSSKRTLAVLTRNNAGAIAALNLLKMAGLAEYFSAIWGMAHGVPAGVYRDGATWKRFEPPLDKIADNKADVLYSIAGNPHAWFPQAGDNCIDLPGLRIEEVVLVDDVSMNFQSGPPDDPKKVLRCCKVAQYDGQHPDVGFVSDMGGIGAHSPEDFETLVSFVRSPWDFKTCISARCVERPFPGSEHKPPVKLVVFDFDETLSLYTFLPKEQRCSTEIGYFGATEQARKMYIENNFESPYLEGRRVPKLQTLLHQLSLGRTMAVLTENKAGAVAVLNLLMMAGLSEHFAAIWTLSADPNRPSGVFKDGSEWRVMEKPLPLSQREDKANYKAYVLQSIVDSPSAWFPQVEENQEIEVFEALRNLKLEGIVLVDDKRESFKVFSEHEPRVLRYCKVGSYDDEYRKEGLICHMGGLGARTDEDYEKLKTFVERPWHYAERQPPTTPHAGTDEQPPVRLQRSNTEEELAQMNGRTATAASSQPDPGSNPFHMSQ